MIPLSRTPKTFAYAIDVLSGCDLRCPSCPVENMRDLPVPTALMSPEAFEGILLKIKRETPRVKRIDLFNWSEPTLHPRLPQFLGIARRHGLPVVLSSNFNTWGALDEVLREEPAGIQISLSGFFQETYERAHAGGDIERVKANLRRLRETMDRFGRRASVRVTYYCYIDNLGEDFERMRDLCRSLGFRFLPLWAYLMPVEKLLEASEGRPAAEGSRRLLDRLVAPPEEALKRARRLASPGCFLRSHRTSINSDGSVALCCGVYDRKHDIAPRFMDVSFEELQDLKARHPLCERCTGNGVRDVLLYSDFAAWNRLAAARIRPRKLPRELLKVGWFFDARRRLERALPGVYIAR